MLHSSILCHPFQTGLPCPVNPVVLQRLALLHAIAPVPGFPPTSMCSCPVMRGIRRLTSDDHPAQLRISSSATLIKPISLAIWRSSSELDVVDPSRTRKERFWSSSSLLLRFGPSARADLLRLPSQLACHRYLLPMAFHRLRCLCRAVAPCHRARYQLLGLLYRPRPPGRPASSPLRPLCLLYFQIVAELVDQV